jgi:uncharacterized damage-inducible protein DinB
MPLACALAAVEDLRHAHRELLRVVDSLTDEEWSRPVPYGEWTVKDLVAHVIGDMSPSGPGLILAGVLTPQFIADTSATFDVRARNAALVEERRRYSKEDLRQLLFEAHDAMIEAALRLDESHRPVLDYPVPMGPGYELRVEDWLWHGYHDRQHADDIRRALDVEYQRQDLKFLPEVEATFRAMFRYREGLLRAIYSVDDQAWEEPSPDPGWTNRDLLAHVASNELRVHVRLRGLLGEATEDETAEVNDVDGWNQRQVEARRHLNVRQLVDEMAANRYQTLLILARLEPGHLRRPVALAGGRDCSLVEYIGMFTGHESVHAGQLVPASRARRFARRQEI